MTRVAVASRSFSRHPVLRAELLARYPESTFNDTGAILEKKALVEFLKGHDKAITGLERLDGPLFDAVPELRVVGKVGVGFDMIDLAAMAARGLQLGWTAGVNRRSVSELVIAFIVALLRHVPVCARTTRAGEWRAVKGRELSGRTVGIVGCGNIGKDLVVLLRPFGCRLLVHDIRSFPEFYAEHDVTPVELEDLLSAADVVTLHLPLDQSTRNILDANRLSRMRPGAILVNAARGGLVDERALKELLKSGHMAAAAFDVFATEPPDDPELLGLDNFLATPHIGASTDEAILAMGRAAIAGLDEHRIPGGGWPDGFRD